MGWTCWDEGHAVPTSAATLLGCWNLQQLYTPTLWWKFHGFERLQMSHSHRKPTETERVSVRNTGTANPRCCYDTVNGEGGFARLEYNVSKAISDYYPIHLNYNMIRKNKKSPTLQQSAVFCISPPAVSAVIMTMPPIMLITFKKNLIFGNHHLNTTQRAKEPNKALICATSFPSPEKSVFRQKYDRILNYHCI